MAIFFILFFSVTIQWVVCYRFSARNCCCTAAEKKRKQSNYTKQIKTQIYLFARPKQNNQFLCVYCIEIMPFISMGYLTCFSDDLYILSITSSIQLAAPFKFLYSKIATGVKGYKFANINSNFCASSSFSGTENNKSLSDHLSICPIQEDIYSLHIHCIQSTIKKNIKIQKRRRMIMGQQPSNGADQHSNCSTQQRLLFTAVFAYIKDVFIDVYTEDMGC